MSFTLGPTSFEALDSIKKVAEKYGYRLFLTFRDIVVDATEMQEEFPDMYYNLKVKMMEEDMFMYGNDNDEEVKEWLQDVPQILGSSIEIELSPTSKAKEQKHHYMTYGNVSVWVDKLREEFSECVSTSSFDMKDPDVRINYPYRDGILIGCFGQHLEKYFGEEKITSHMTF